MLPRTEKYKAKNFNDTFVYRVGDQVGAWSYTAMGWLGLGVSGLAFSMVPVSVIWLVLTLWLGKRYRDYNSASATQVMSESDTDSVPVATSNASPG